jgi:hypothetical protein
MFIRPTSKTKKKGVSVIVAYVLLIMVALGLSSVVYVWLRGQVDIIPDDSFSCPDEVSILITDYDYADGKLNLTVRNKGFFNVSGFYIRASNISESKLGIIEINNSNEALAPNEDIQFENIDVSSNGKLCYVQVQPYLVKGGEEFFCDTISDFELAC